MSGTQRIIGLSFLLACALMGLGWTIGPPTVVQAWWHRADPPAPSVIFVVLDTVRADHLSLCGYERPTSPTLARMAEQGAAWTCNAYAPGSWTVPSHGSFFTGQPVVEHGTHFSQGEGEDVRQMSIAPLDDDVETLAETMRDRGYQTVGISGNPVLVPRSGLTQGFDHWAQAPRFGSWYGEHLVDRLETSLQAADPDRPLFLFVNIADAHDPWDGVPEGLGWVEPTDRTVHYFHPEHPPLWSDFATGEVDDRDALADELTDLYDHALFEADRTLGRTLSIIEDYGWLSAGHRLVVVSDHGEFLGEDDLLRHGRYLHEANQRVPLLVRDSTAPPPALPETVSALDAYHLARDGRLPEEPSPATAVAFPDELWLERSDGMLGGETSAAVWTDHAKLLWIDGETQRFTLRGPRAVTVDEPVEEHPLSDRLEALAREAQASLDREVRGSEAMVEALQAMGYVQ